MPVTGHVTWKPSDIINWYSVGQIPEGDVRIQIERTEATLEMIDNTRYIIVDGRRVELNKVIPRGVQGLNRLLIDCIEVAKE